MKNVFKLAAKNVLIRLGLTAAAIAADVGIHKRYFRFGDETLTISKDVMQDIMKIIKFLEESGLLIKTETMTKCSKRTSRRTSWHVIRYISC